MGYMKLADNTCKWNVYISELSLLNLLYVYRQFLDSVLLVLSGITLALVLI